ncbi:efflux RND transporter periplasmic adaptor subunit [Pukyongiella litopenaei]|uniref:Efflux RND transporter periplasmic adaptor subunit n=1 Tax=Pukyongiella litopenaei TaxID=2605946 RepID=A0A2S0MM60_9RHOB|nr:efflux RND transporter periplasmic adaptor subunit [Pukyongiella litopenaei]AVO36970.1 efflux RND transporter periplasmic adaptor subunit [Pukyongiella litopenaei]
MKLLNLACLLIALGAAPLAAETLPKPARLMVVSTEAQPLERQFFGQVAARRSVDLAFQVGGQVLRFPVSEGFTIAGGELIAQLDLEQFELQLDQARLQKEQADRTLERLNKLKGSTVSQVALDDAQTAASLAAIGLRNAEWALRHATLTAPFDALVSSRNVELFSTVAAGAPVVRIHDMSELYIEVDVPETLFQRARDEDHARITARFPGDPAEYPLTFREFVAETSSVGQTFRITLAMTPPEGRNILPGSSATVQVRVPDQYTGILVPSSAIVMDTHGVPGVMRFDPRGADTGTVTWVPATIEPTQSGDVRITGGLENGAEIVLTGGAAMTDGQAVRRFAGFPN